MNIQEPLFKMIYWDSEYNLTWSQIQNANKFSGCVLCADSLLQQPLPLWHRCQSATVAKLKDERGKIWKERWRESGMDRRGWKRCIIKNQRLNREQKVRRRSVWLLMWHVNYCTSKQCMCVCFHRWWGNNDDWLKFSAEYGWLGNKSGAHWKVYNWICDHITFLTSENANIY